MKKKQWLIMLVAMGMLALGLTGCSPAKEAEATSENEVSNETVAAETTQVKDDYKITVGYYNCDHMTAAAVGEAAGIYTELGLDVEITGNGKVPQAMAAGQMDVGYIGTRGFMAAVAKGSPMAIGADNHIGGSMYLVVSNDIEKPEDLLGQPVAFGNIEKSEGWLCGYSQLTGLPTDPEQYELVTIGSDADKYLALKTGKIKAFTCCDPWGSYAEFEGTGRIMATYFEMDGEMGECCVLSLNKKFVKDHPVLAEKMVLAHTQSLAYIYTHPYHSAEIFADYYKVPVEVALRTIYKKTVHEGRTLTWKIDKERFEHARATYEKFNLIDGDVPTYEDVVLEDMHAKSGARDFDTFIAEEVDPLFPIGMPYEEWVVKAKEIDEK